MSFRDPLRTMPPVPGRQSGNSRRSKRTVSSRASPWSGRDRVDLFRNYIAAIERHEIVCPRIDVFYTEHLYCGEDDLFGSGHPPDTVVAMALAYHAFKTGRRPGDYGVTI